LLPSSAGTYLTAGLEMVILWTAPVAVRLVLVLRITSNVQYEHAPLQVRCAMLRKHPPVGPVLSILSRFCPL